MFRNIFNNDLAEIYEKAFRDFIGPISYWLHGRFRHRTHTVTPTHTSTPTLCPQATPEPLWVDSVVSSTGLLTQTIVVRAGNSEWVEVDTGYGTYSETARFNAYSNPAYIEIPLLLGQIHQLTVSSRVREVTQGDCVYGGYTLTTTRDRNGELLEILQESE